MIIFLVISAYISETSGYDDCIKWACKNGWKFIKTSPACGKTGAESLAALDTELVFCENRPEVLGSHLHWDTHWNFKVTRFNNIGYNVILNFTKFRFYSILWYSNNRTGTGIYFQKIISLETCFSKAMEHF